MRCKHLWAHLGPLSFLPGQVWPAIANLPTRKGRERKRKVFLSCWYPECFVINCSPDDLSLERDRFTWLAQQTLPKSAPQVSAHRPILSVCLSFWLSSKKLRAFPTHQGPQGLPAEGIEGCPCLVHGLDLKQEFWLYFSVTTDGMGYLEILENHLGNNE